MGVNTVKAGPVEYDVPIPEEDENSRKQAASLPGVLRSLAKQPIGASVVVGKAPTLVKNAVYYLKRDPTFRAEFVIRPEGDGSRVWRTKDRKK